MNHISFQSRRGRFAAVLVWSIACLSLSADAFAIDLRRLWPVEGSGTVIKETRDLGPFSAVSAGASASVEIRIGEREAVEIEADDNLMPLIDTDVQNGVLQIGTNKSFKASKFKVIVHARSIRALTAHGAATLVLDSLEAPRLAVAVGGSAVVTVRSLKAKNVSAEIGGSGEVKLAGEADELSVSLGGSGVLRAAQLKARTLSLQAGGAAQAVVWASDTMTLAVGGAARVSYYGNAHVTSANSGAGVVKQLAVAPPAP